MQNAFGRKIYFIEIKKLPNTLKKLQNAFQFIEIYAMNFQ